MSDIETKAREAWIKYAGFLSGWTDTDKYITAALDRLAELERVTHYINGVVRNTNNMRDERDAAIRERDEAVSKMKGWARVAEKERDEMKQKWADAEAALFRVVTERDELLSNVFGKTKALMQRDEELARVKELENHFHNCADVGRRLEVRVEELGERLQASEAEAATLREALKTITALALELDHDSEPACSLAGQINVTAGAALMTTDAGKVVKP